MQNLFLAALVLAVFVYFEQMLISTMTIGSNPPILGGIVAGLVLGDIQLGLYIGTVLTLMSLGMYTFGGAAIPNYFLGSVLGTAVAILMMRANPALASSEAINIAIPPSPSRLRWSSSRWDPFPRSCVRPWFRLWSKAQRKAI